MVVQEALVLRGSTYIWNVSKASGSQLFGTRATHAE